MPSTRKKVNKSGQTFYEIRVSRGRGKSYLTKRWYVPEGWSQRAIDRELASVAAEFERQCSNGEIISRAEQREKDAQEAAEAARILTLKTIRKTGVYARKGRHDQRKRAIQLSGLFRPRSLSGTWQYQNAGDHARANYRASS